MTVPKSLTIWKKKISILLLISAYIFISYRHTEKNTVNNLASGLFIAQNYLYKSLKNMGYSVYYASQCDRIGEYSVHIERAVEECKIFLWVLSSVC